MAIRNKLTKSNRLRNRKKLTPDIVAENNFVSAILKSIKVDIDSENFNLEKTIASLKGAKLRNLKKLARQFGFKLLKRNRKGFENIVSAMIAGTANVTKRTRNEKILKKALKSFTEEKKIYEPILEKFNENVQLIKNVPSDVANALEKAYKTGEGLRGSDAEKFIQERMGRRARLIIRTESSKINTALTEVRAKSMGISCYIWSTSMDQRVRASHKMMDGILVFWNNNVTLDNMTGHAGEFPNCRCVPLPIFELDDIKFPIKVAHNLVLQGKYNRSTKKDVAKIISGTMKSYDKNEFVKKFGDNFS